MADQIKYRHAENTTHHYYSLGNTTLALSKLRGRSRPRGTTRKTHIHFRPRWGKGYGHCPLPNSVQTIYRFCRFVWSDTKGLSKEWPEFDSHQRYFDPLILHIHNEYAPVHECSFSTNCMSEFIFFTTNKSRGFTWQDMHDGWQMGTYIHTYIHTKCVQKLHGKDQLEDWN
jgi:hypothetical protein